MSETEKIDVGSSPYLEARREWEERYGSYLSSAKTWRITAFVCLVTTLIATAGTICIAWQKEVTPYIVEVDKLGAILQVKRADTPNQATVQRVVTAQLADFVKKTRGVVLDARLQRENIFKVYAYLQKNTPAFTKVTGFFKANDPFERAKKETVFAEILNVLPLKDNAYQIEWRETVMDRQSGQTLTVTNYKLVAYTTVSPPNDEASILKNPMGLIINDLNWSKEI